MRILFPLNLLAGMALAATGASAASAGTLNVVFQPSGGEAAIITTQNFRVCRVRGIEAWNMDTCPFWRPLGSGVRAFLGFYCVQGWWGNRPQFRSSLDMSLSVRHRELVITQQQDRKSVCL